jgi:hypothetical protein
MSCNTLDSRRSTERFSPTNFESLLLVLLPLLAVALAYRTAPTFALLGDAGFLIVDNPLMRDWKNLPDMLTHDYFWAPAEENIGYWRPLTKGSWLVETILGSGRPWVYHVVQVFWLAVAVSGVQALGVKIQLTLRQATLAALMFALHPAVIEPVSLAMARSDVVCLAGLVWAMTAWFNWRESGKASWLIFHCIGLIIAYGSKETSVISLPLLIIWALLAKDNYSIRRLTNSLIPVLFITVIYLLLRDFFLTDATGPSVKLEPLKLVVGYGTYLRGLLPFTFDTGIRNLSFQEAFSGAVVARSFAACAILGFVIILCAAKRWRHALVLVLWMLASLALVLIFGQMHVPQGDEKLVMSDRWMIHAAAATSLLFVLVISKVASPLLSKTLAMAVIVWCVAAILAAPMLHAPYKNDMTILNLEDIKYQATPERFRTDTDKCRHVERALSRASASDDLEGTLQTFRQIQSQPACSDSPWSELSVIQVLLNHQRYTEALPIAENLLTHSIMGRLRNHILALAGMTFYHNGRTEQALTMMQNAVAGGLTRNCLLLSTFSQALAAYGDLVNAGMKLEEAFDCNLRQTGRSNPSALFLTAELFAQGGSTEEALRITNRLKTLVLDKKDSEKLKNLVAELNLPAEPD